MSEKENVRVHHKLNGGEVCIGRYLVDGMSKDGKVMYEFYGCYFHGCPHCVKNRQQQSADQRLTMAEVFQRMMDKEQYLKSLGYWVVTKWQCQLQRELDDNPAMKQFFDDIRQIDDPIMGQDGFYSGRTSSIKLYHKCDEGERIRYIDVCSLYPWVCKMKSFPVGHLQIVTKNFDIDWTKYKGLIKCEVLPPRGLYLRVLPSRHNSKLMFPLCRTC